MNESDAEDIASSMYLRDFDLSTKKKEMDGPKLVPTPHRQLKMIDADFSSPTVVKNKPHLRKTDDLPNRVSVLPPELTHELRSESQDSAIF